MNAIDIELPELSLDDMSEHECFSCDGTMIPCFVAGVYRYKDRDYRVSGMRVWKCKKCGMECYTGPEADRVTDAIWKRAEAE